MDVLLFQNQPILWIGSWIPSFFVALSIAVAIFFIPFLYKKYKHREKHIPLQPYQMIDPGDVRFQEKTLLALKSYLRERFVPHHVLAHTPEEIGRYVENQEIITILTDLEIGSYQGISLSFTDAEAINISIQHALNSSGL